MNDTSFLVQSSPLFELGIMLVALLILGTSANGYQKAKGALRSVWVMLVFVAVMVAVKSAMSLLDLMEIYSFSSWFYFIELLIVSAVLLAVVNLKRVKASKK